MATLDTVDYEIISLLQEDGRRPSVEIAQRIGVSEATVRRRVERLIEQDIIRIAAVSDPLKLGFPVVVIVGLKVERGQLSEAAKALAVLSEVRFLGYTAGRHDLVFEAWFGSNQQLLEFLSQRLAGIAGIRDVEVSHVLEMVKYTYDWGKGDIAALAEKALR